MTAARITPGSRREIGLVNQAICWVSGRVTGTNPPNLFTTLGRNRGMFRGWMWYSSKLMPFGRLSRRETELMILRIAHLRDSEYEFAHHVRLGRRAGVRPVDVERVQQGPGVDGWSAREQSMLQAIDELSSLRDVTSPTWERLREVLDERECIELVMLSGQYESLATTIATLRIQPDR